MMRESNRVFFLKKSKDFAPFYDRLRVYLAAAEVGSLAELCSRAPTTALTCPEPQMTHWMFAMAQTLATNTLRALALIVAHPKAEERVRLQIRKNQTFAPDDIASCKYLEGCLQEAMRLWPTTPPLAREMLAENRLGGEVIPARTQVLILNSFLHRDGETHYFGATDLRFARAKTSRSALARPSWRNC
jgi:hypothetical protein